MRLSVRTKLFAGYGAVLVLMVVLCVIAISKMGALHDSASKINDDVLTSIELVDDVAIAAGIYRQDQYALIGR